MTIEARLKEVEAQHGAEAMCAARDGVYFKKAICEIMHGRITNTWPDHPSEKILMEDGTELHWTYEYRYWAEE